MDFEKNGNGPVYHGSDCGPGRVKIIQDGGAGAESECDQDTVHPDLMQIVWDVLKAGEDVLLPCYGFHPHYWTLDELKEAYKIKTGNDFVEDRML